MTGKDATPRSAARGVPADPHSPIHRELLQIEVSPEVLLWPFDRRCVGGPATAATATQDRLILLEADRCIASRHWNAPWSGARGRQSEPVARRGAHLPEVSSVDSENLRGRRRGGYRISPHGRSIAECISSANKPCDQTRSEGGSTSDPLSDLRPRWPTGQARSTIDLHLGVGLRHFPRYGVSLDVRFVLHLPAPFETGL